MSEKKTTPLMIIGAPGKHARTDKKMEFLLEKYLEKHPDHEGPFDPEAICEWAIGVGIYVPHKPPSPVDQLRKRFSRHLSHRYFTDPQNREVRALHFVPTEELTPDGVKHGYLYYPLFTTEPEKIKISLGVRRDGARNRVPAGHAHGPKAHDGTITTAAPDVMWGTDMTSTVTVGEGATCVFVAVDHCTTECIGLHAAKRGTRFEALEPIRQGVRERFGPISDGVARGLRLRHDHGSNYLADDFQQEVAFFGIESSPSFVREPEGNGVAERFIRTLKENLLWVRSFETIEELRLALLEFQRTYNEQWMLAKYDYRSPAQVRRDFDGLDAVA